MQNIGAAVVDSSKSEIVSVRKNFLSFCSLDYSSSWLSLWS